MLAKLDADCCVRTATWTTVNTQADFMYWFESIWQHTILMTASIAGSALVKWVKWLGALTVHVFSCKPPFLTQLLLSRFDHFSGSNANVIRVGRLFAHPYQITQLSFSCEWSTAPLNR